MMNSLTTDDFAFQALGADEGLGLVSPYPVFPKGTNLFAISNKYELYVAAGVDGLTTGSLNSLRRAVRERDQEEIDKNIASFYTPSDSVRQLVFSSDEEVLAVVRTDFVDFVDLRGQKLIWSAEVGSCQCVVPRSANGADFAVLGAGGPALLNTQYKSRELLIADLSPPHIGALAWIPGGVELLAAVDNELLIYRVFGEPGTRLKMPQHVRDEVDATANGAVGVFALTSDSFLAVYKSSDKDESHVLKPYLVVRDGSGGSDWKLLTGICTSFDDNGRAPAFYAHWIVNWSPNLPILLALASAQSPDLGMATDSHTVEFLNDEDRAALPFTDDDTSAVGFALDISSTEPVEKPSDSMTSCSALPIVWLLNNEGNVCAWHLIYRPDLHSAEQKMAALRSLYQNDLKEARDNAECMRPDNASDKSRSDSDEPKDPLTLTPRTPSKTVKPNETEAVAEKLEPTAEPDSIAQRNAKPNAAQDRSTSQETSRPSPFAKPSFADFQIKPLSPAFGGKPGFGETKAEPVSTQPSAQAQAPTPAFGKSGFGQSGFGQSGFGQSGFGQSGFGQSGFGQSGFGQSGFKSSAFGQSSTTTPYTDGAVSGQPFFSDKTGTGSTSPFNGQPSKPVFGTSSPFGSQPAFGKVDKSSIFEPKKGEPMHTLEQSPSQPREEVVKEDLQTEIVDSRAEAKPKATSAEEKPEGEIRATHDGSNDPKVKTPAREGAIGKNQPSFGQSSFMGFSTSPSDAFKYSTGAGSAFARGNSSGFASSVFSPKSPDGKPLLVPASSTRKAGSESSSEREREPGSFDDPLETLESLTLDKSATDVVTESLSSTPTKPAFSLQSGGLSGSRWAQQADAPVFGQDTVDRSLKEPDATTPNKVFDFTKAQANVPRASTLFGADNEAAATGQKAVVDFSQTQEKHSGEGLFSRLQPRQVSESESNEDEAEDEDEDVEDEDEDGVEVGVDDEDEDEQEEEDEDEDEDDEDEEDEEDEDDDEEEDGEEQDIDEEDEVDDEVADMAPSNPLSRLLSSARSVAEAENIPLENAAEASATGETDYEDEIDYEDVEDKEKEEVPGVPTLPSEPSKLFTGFTRPVVEPQRDPEDSFERVKAEFVEAQSEKAELASPPAPARSPSPVMVPDSTSFLEESTILDDNGLEVLAPTTPAMSDEEYVELELDNEPEEETEPELEEPQLLEYFRDISQLEDEPECTDGDHSSVFDAMYVAIEDQFRLNRINRDNLAVYLGWHSDDKEQEPFQMDEALLLDCWRLSDAGDINGLIDGLSVEVDELRAQGDQSFDDARAKDIHARLHKLAIQLERVGELVKYRAGAISERMLSRRELSVTAMEQQRQLRQTLAHVEQSLHNVESEINVFKSRISTTSQVPGSVGLAPRLDRLRQALSKVSHLIKDRALQVDNLRQRLAEVTLAGMSPGTPGSVARQQQSFYERQRSIHQAVNLMEWHARRRLRERLGQELRQRPAKVVEVDAVLVSKEVK